MKKLWLIPLIIVLLSSLLMGCSSEQSAPAAESTTQSATSTTSSSGSDTSSATSESTPAASNDEVVELRFSHHNPPTGRTTVKFLDPWAEQVAEATGGKVKITMYPAQSLAKSKENIEAVQGGIADMAWLNMGNWTGKFPLMEVMNLPFINLPSGTVDGKALGPGGINSHILQELAEQYPEISGQLEGVKVLFLHTSDPYVICTTKKPVSNLDELQGMKLRTFGKYPTEMYKLTGASTVLLPMPDVYESAEKGVIDGMAVNWAAVATFKLYEVYKYWSDISTDVAVFAVIMNQSKWDSLSPDVQDAIMSVSGIQGAEFAGETAFGADLKDEIFANAAAEGLDFERVAFDNADLATWKKIAAEPLWQQWLEETESKGLPGQEIFDEAQRLIELYSD